LRPHGPGAWLYYRGIAPSIRHAGGRARCAPLGRSRQRIGIVRAPYHNPDILVFDEATSALDALTERAVTQAINAPAQQETIILIAHRLSTVKNRHQIVLLEHGHDQAKGTYAELTQSHAGFAPTAGSNLARSTGKNRWKR